jgi:hypothetical protein
MEPITVILGALAAGAASGALDALKDDAQAAYGKLRGLVRKRLSANPDAELALAEYEADPKTGHVPLAAKLKEVGAGEDADLLAAARTLMELLDHAGAKSGKYDVTIKGSSGVQIGDGNIQVNTY